MNQKEELYSRRDELEHCLNSLRSFTGDGQLKDVFSEIIAGQVKKYGRSYITAIQKLDHGEAEIGNKWLQGIAEHTVEHSLNIIPSLK